MQQQSHLQINIGKSKIDPYFIQTCLDSVKTQQQKFQVLANTFSILELARKDKNKYLDEIQKLIKSNLYLPVSSSAVNHPKSAIDFNAVHPLIKGGGFGTLERQCQITDKGLLEKQDKKQPVLKTVVGFSNKIQKHGEKDNDKIEWVKDNKQYPYRIVVQGDKKQPKAIFFADSHAAQKVRLFYVNKFNYKGNVTKLMRQSQQIFKQTLVQNFKYTIIAAKTQKKKLKLQARELRMNEKSEEGKLNDFPTEQMPGMSSNQANNSFNREDPNNNILGRASNPKSHMPQSKALQFLLNKQDDRLSSKTAAKSKANFGTFLKLEKLYHRHFFQSWLNQAKQVSGNRSRADQSLMNNSRLSTTKKQGQNQSHIKHSVLQIPSNKSFAQSKSKAIQHSEKQISFTKIQFLNLNNTLVKPIVTIQLMLAQNKQYQCVFNTMIRSKNPHLSYQLIPTNGEPEHLIKNELTNYQVKIRVVDYLTNSEICDDIISLKTKVFSFYTLLLNQEKTIRLEMKCVSQQFSRSQNHTRLQDNPEGSYLQISPFKQIHVEKIRQYWGQQSVKKGYYNVSKDIKIMQILQLIQEMPVSWSVGLNEEEYKIIYYLTAASKILGFKLIPSLLQIVRVLQRIYSETEQLIEACLSIVTNNLYSYYYPQQFSKTQEIHRVIGLEGDIEFSSKIWLQLAIIRKLVKIEAPDVEDKMTRKNIAYCYLLYEYVFKMYAKVFPIKILIEIWNFCFRDSQNIRTYLILIGVWLMKFYSKKIMLCRRTRQLSQVLESQQLCSSQIIIKQVLILRQKYFGGQNKSLIEQIKGFFDQKPLEQVAIQFYKRETWRMDERKEKRTVQKEAVLFKLNKQLQIQLPSYPLRKYCFHLYFYRLPAVPGSLYIKANDIQYECLNFTKNSYFILGEIGSQISIEFVNNKSNQFSAKMVLVLGINKFALDLTSSKHKQSYHIEYLCGLLTQSHIQALKKNRRFEHYIAPFMSKQQIFDEFLRPVNESQFLNSYTKRLERQDLGKKIKIIFSSGNKSFDEVEFYLSWIASSPLSLQQKLILVKQYAQNISQEFYLSHNRQLEKIFIKQFITMIQYPISPIQFECFYADSIESQFNAAKLLKCRLFLPSGKQYKLQETALQYYIKRTNDGLYGDIFIPSLLQKISQKMQSQLSNVSQATLSLLYSSNGQVHHIEMPVVRKKSSKQLVLDQQKYDLDNPNERGNIQLVQPQILVTQILPTFSKITSILDYVHQSEVKSADKFEKYQRQKNAEQMKIPDNLNLLKICNHKLGKVIMMRYHSYPDNLRFPFLEYFHDLIYNIKAPHLAKNIYINNTKADIKTICCIDGKLNFSDNKRSQPLQFRKNEGLYGNLRILPSQTDSLYFTTVLADQQAKANAFLFVNYGYGVFRWQPCLILGYNYISSEKQSRIKQQKKIKKSYLVKYQQKQQYYRQVQLQFDPRVEENLQQLDYKPKTEYSKIAKTNKSKTPKSVGLSKLLEYNN